MLNFDLMDSVAGRQVYDMGFQKGIQKVIEKAREDVLEVLEERFGIIPADIIKQIRAIAMEEHLKQFLKQGIRCPDIDSFREMLSKVVPKQSTDSVSIE